MRKPSSQTAGITMGKILPDTRTLTGKATGTVGGDRLGAFRPGRNGRVGNASDVRAWGQDLDARPGREGNDR